MGLLRFELLETSLQCSRLTHVANDPGDLLLHIRACAGGGGLHEVSFRNLAEIIADIDANDAT